MPMDLTGACRNRKVQCQRSSSRPAQAHRLNRSCYHEQMNFLRFTVFLTGAVWLFGQAPAPNPAPANPPARVVITPATPAVTPPVAPDKVVLAVGEEKVTAAEFEQLVDALPEQFRATARGPNRRQFA